MTRYRFTLYNLLFYMARDTYKSSVKVAQMQSHLAYTSIGCSAGYVTRAKPHDSPHLFTWLLFRFPTAIIMQLSVVGAYLMGAAVWCVEYPLRLALSALIQRIKEGRK